MGNKRKWIIFYFIVLAAVGSIGFYIIGGDQWSWIDSLFMTIITLSTVGYGEVHSLTSAGKIWSILIIIFGVTGIGAFIRTLNEEFIQLAIFRKNTMMKTISKLKLADGLVVGSAICKEISKSLAKRQNPVTNVSNMVKRLKNKII